MSDPNFNSCPTRALRRVPNFNGRDGIDGPEDHINRRKTTDESDDEEIVYRGHPIRHTLKETQWQFKRRDHSDRSSQPNSAPSGYHAQKAENFQKFYRAVVSPTHVRVTAGGRIVPNVRAPPQPIFVWNRDKHFFEAKQHKKSSGSIDTAWQEGAALKPSDPNQLHINASNTDGNPAPVSNPQPSEKPLGSISSENLQYLPCAEQFPSANTLTNGGAQSSSVRSHPIKLSPPGQFDMTKPFMLNGHMVYPLPANFQVPQGVSVLDIFGGNTASQEHLQCLPHQHSPYPQGAFQPDISAPQTSAIPLPPLVMAPAPQVLPIIPMMPTAAPAIKNIDRRGRLPVMPPLPGLGYQPELMQPRLVRQQIQSLQNEIKKFDHQLEHNKHQIDEAHVKKQRFYVQSQIQTLEASLALLPVDVPVFNQSFPGAPSSYSSVVASSQPVLPAWTASAAYKSKSFDETSKQPSFSYVSSGREVRSESFTNVATGTQAVSSAVVSAKMPIVKAEPPPRKRLSLSAAKAPPFKPRSQQALVQATTPPSMKANEEIVSTEPVFDIGEVTNPKESVEDIEARLTCNANKWFKAKDETILPSSMNSSAEGLNSVRVHDNYHYEDGLSTPVSQRQGTGPFQVPGEDMMTPLTPHGTGRVLPYLLGFPPPGTAFKEAKSHEFTYARPLTPEEIRARHLYWGNASKEALKGLPKFDGKDFYPPSPQKASTLPVNHSSSSETSTVVRKSNTSSATSKGVESSEESGVLIKVIEGDSPGKIVGQCGEKIDEKIHENDDKISIDSWGASKTVLTPPMPTQAIAAKVGRSPTAHSSNSFLLGLLKNSPAVSSPLSGVSSAHAVGSLPNYGGAAVSSLAPGLRSRSSAAFDLPTAIVRRSASKLSFENRTPSQAGSVVANVSTASELLSRIARQNEERQGEVYLDCNSEAILAGPVTGSNW
jgi:hypothetical protein